MNDINCGESWLLSNVNNTNHKDEMIDLLIGSIAPCKHHSDIGLIATRKFKENFGAQIN